MTIRRRVSAATKARIALEAIRGRTSIERIAAEHCVPAELVTEWAQELTAGAARAFEPPRRAPSAPRSEVWLNAIAESAPVGVMFKDRSRRVVLVNKSFCDFLALPREAVLGKHSDEFRPPEIARQIREMDLDVLTRGVFRYEEWTCLHEGGELRIYSTTKFPVKDGKGRILGICGIAVEVTERSRAEFALRMSEAHLAAVINHAPASISLKDADGRYLLVNEEVARRFGRQVSDFPGRTIFDFADPETAASVAARDREALERCAVTQHEVEALDRDGVRRTLMVIRFPVIDRGNRVAAIGTISMDISAQKATEAELRLAKNAAEVASRAKTEFLANMSHELRTPLNSIIGFSQIISGQMFGPTGNPKYREYAADILHSGRNLLELINDILDVSKIEIGGLTLDEEHLEVTALLREATGMVAERAAEKRLDLRTVVPHALPILKADQRRVRQILVNLLSNAIKFTPPAGRIELWARTDDEGGIVLGVTDSGIGIAADKIDLALTMFGQIEDPMIRSSEGVGLGLPLCKKLAEMHGGRLEIESTPGLGTTVSIAFPLERSVESRRTRRRVRAS